MQRRYFITGIGTNVGKTLVSALLCEYLKADYFKPVQTGYPPDRDSDWIKNHVSYSIVIHPENYLLRLPASPYQAAKREGIEIALEGIRIPHTKNTLIIEGAGGLLVPLNSQYYIADLIKHFNAECILVVSSYLGCINHSLLSLFYIMQNNIPFRGVILNGDFEDEVKYAIVKNLTPQQIISEIPFYPGLSVLNFREMFEVFQRNIKTEL